MVNYPVYTEGVQSNFGPVSDYDCVNQRATKSALVSIIFNQHSLLMPTRLTFNPPSSQEEARYS